MNVKITITQKEADVLKEHLSETFNNYNFPDDFKSDMENAIEQKLFNMSIRWDEKTDSFEFVIK